MSDLSDAFGDLQTAFDDVLGGAQTIIIGATAYPAVIEDVTFDQLITAGGEGDQGGFQAQVRIADLAAKPAHLAQVTARGKTCDLLTVANVNGTVWLLTCGHIAAEGN